MRIRTALVLGYFFAAPVLALGQAAPAPPTVPLAPTVPPAPTVPAAPTPPSPTVPTPTPAAPTLTPAPAPAAPAAPTVPAAPSQPANQTTAGFTFTLGNAANNVAPYTHGDAKTEEGKIDVTTEPNVLKLVMTGGVGANVFLGAESTAIQSFSVNQEFEITSSDPSVTEVTLTMDSGLVGFVRSKHRASACVQLASVVIAPLGWSTAPLSASHQPLCVCGPNQQQACEPLGVLNKDPLAPVTSQPLPLGRYVIQANFIIQATASGFLDAHSAAIFSPEPTELDPWEREHDIFKGEDKAGYGFTTILTAAPANKATATNAWEKHQRQMKKVALARKNAKKDKAQDTVIR